MLSRDEILDDLTGAGALLSGHFLLTSGLHSAQYIQCAALLKQPNLAGKLCQELAGKVRQYRPEVIIGPAMGGIIVAYEVARALKLSGIFAERKAGRMQLRRNFQITPGERVVVVEDVVTTGRSVKEVITLIKQQRGELVAVAALIDRSGGKTDFGVPFASLLTLDIEVYSTEDCPLCRTGSPVVKPGSRD